MKILLLGLAALTLSAGDAAAQYDAVGAAAIGTQISRGRAHEKECEAGKPPNPDIAPDLEKRSEDRLAQYFDGVGGSDKSRVAGLFIDRGGMARWTGPDGTQPVKAIVDPVGAQRAKGTLTRKALVAGGDNLSVRGVWVLTIPKSEDPSKTETYEYGVDFKLGGFGGMWLWHVHLYRAPDTAPLPPDAFCHIDPDSPY